MFDAYSADALGYLAAALVFLTFVMKRMASLRIIAIASNVAFILYAVSVGLTPILILHGLLLPLNIARLYQFMKVVRAASAIDGQNSGEETFGWLIRVAKRRKLPAGTTIFRKGDKGRSVFIVIDGEVFLPEIGVTLSRGALLGEISMFSSDGLRTVSAEAKGAVELGELTERRMRELYLDSPSFAYSLIRLITARLQANAQVPNAEGQQVGGADPERSARIETGMP
nr:cyclic nucleotide-binding domain-containing protein [Sinirhodobacter sp. WL0062]